MWQSNLQTQQWNFPLPSDTHAHSLSFHCHPPHPPHCWTGQLQSFKGNDGMVLQKDVALGLFQRKQGSWLAECRWKKLQTMGPDRQEFYRDPYGGGAPHTFRKWTVVNTLPLYRAVNLLCLPGRKLLKWFFSVCLSKSDEFENLLILCYLMHRLWKSLACSKQRLPYIYITIQSNVGKTFQFCWCV